MKKAPYLLTYYIGKVENLKGTKVTKWQWKTVTILVLLEILRSPRALGDLKMKKNLVMEIYRRVLHIVLISSDGLSPKNLKYFKPLSIYFHLISNLPSF